MMNVLLNNVSSGTALVALIPIVWLLFSLGYIKMPAYKACLSGLVLSLVIAVVAWKMPYILALRAALEGAVLAVFPIVWVVLAAIFTYNITLRTGAMNRIKSLMANISGDRRIQALIIAWGFGGFLESAAGFGTAVAIPASILIALGFEPIFAAIVCLLANTIAVAFGGIGLPITTLAKLTDLELMKLSLNVVLQLTPFVILIPFVLVFTVTRSLRGIKGVIGTTLVAGASFGIVQLVVAKYLGPELAGILGSIGTMIATTLWAKISPPAEEWRFAYEAGKTVKMAKKDNAGTRSQQLVAWMPYILLLVFIIGTSSIVPAISIPLSNIKSSLLIYNGAGNHRLEIDWVTTPGTMIFLAAIVGGLIQGATVGDLVVVLGRTVQQLQKTIVTVIAIVSMAKVLSYSGMIASIAVALAKTTGKSYPLIAPMIGALGTFITGSDTSSNVIFGSLQKQTAIQIGSNSSWITAANTSGACAGKMVSPQSIAIATSATGLVGKEGEIMNTTIKYLIVFLLGLGLITYAFS